MGVIQGDTRSLNYGSHEALSGKSVRSMVGLGLI